MSTQKRSKIIKMRLYFAFILVAWAALAGQPQAYAQSARQGDTAGRYSVDRLQPLINEYAAFVAQAEPGSSAGAPKDIPYEWGDVRPETLAARALTPADLQRRIAATDTNRDIDKAILVRLLQTHIDADKFDTARVPFTSDWGFQGEPVFAAMQTRLESAEDAAAWTARLNDIPRYFAQTRANLQRGLETGWVSHADPLSTVIAQIREQITAAPETSNLYAPFKSLPGDLPRQQVEQIRRDGLTATQNAIAAYADMLRFLEEDYAPHTRKGAGIARLPHGTDYYQAMLEHHTAGAGYSPAEVHALGKSEVARIRSEMEKIIAETGFKGDFSDFQSFLREDAQFYATSPEDLLKEARDIAKRIDGVLPQYFGTLPRLTYGVEPVPPEIAPGYTTGRYAQGDPVTGRSGTYLVNTYALDQRPLYELPALTAHEAVPGHHLQIALAQELEGVADFRKSYYATAFGEGWGLYAERIAGEAGIYRTPYERFGALSYEMWRACRLVADTGLHWYGWSRDQAEDCFIRNTALSPLNIKTEVTRYMGWPGQATAYKIGELKIRELRARAEEALGEQFDIRSFHDAILEEGALPLDILEIKINAWIAQQAESG